MMGWMTRGLLLIRRNPAGSSEKSNSLLALGNADLMDENMGIDYLEQERYCACWALTSAEEQTSQAAARDCLRTKKSSKEDAVESMHVDSIAGCNEMLHMGIKDSTTFLVMDF